MKIRCAENIRDYENIQGDEKITGERLEGDSRR